MKGKTPQDRQAVRNELARLRGVAPGSIPLPRKNTQLRDYKSQIEALKEAKQIARREAIKHNVDQAKNEIKRCKEQAEKEFNEEAARLGNINPQYTSKFEQHEEKVRRTRKQFRKEVKRLSDINYMPDYTIRFERRAQVTVLNEIIDANYVAHIPVGTLHEDDYWALLATNREAIQQIIQDERQRLGAIRVRIGVSAQMIRSFNYRIGLFNLDDPSLDQGYGFYFKTKYIPILAATNIPEIFEYTLMRVKDKVDNFYNEGSGWTICRVTQIFLEISRYSPVTGSGHIPLPNDLNKRCSTKNGIINPQNTDNECFRWAILCALHTPARNPARISQYRQYYNELDFTGIEFPVKVDEIVYRRFE